MSAPLKFILVLLGLLYLASPVDLVPELYVPLVGWIDDSLVVIYLYHLIRYDRLPADLFKKGRKSPGRKKGDP